MNRAYDPNIVAKGRSNYSSRICGGLIPKGTSSVVYKLHDEDGEYPTVRICIACEKASPLSDREECISCGDIFYLTEMIQSFKPKSRYKDNSDHYCSECFSEEIQDFLDDDNIKNNKETVEKWFIENEDKVKIMSFSVNSIDSIRTHLPHIYEIYKNRFIDVTFGM
jgi:hypothetical protein